MSKKEQPRKKMYKISQLVLAAIHNLGDERGSTAKKILDYITSEYELESNEIKSRVLLTLKKGVNFGILRKEKTRYLIEDSPSVDKTTSDGTRRCQRKNEGKSKRRVKSRSRRRSRTRPRRRGSRRRSRSRSSSRGSRRSRSRSSSQGSRKRSRSRTKRRGSRRRSRSRSSRR